MLAKAGDVYCVYNFHLKKYTACQITKIEEGEKKPQAVLLSLDWSGKQPLREEELSSLKPLYIDFMYWERNLHLSNVDIHVPSHYIFIGNRSPLTTESTNTYAMFWGNGYDIYRQLKWQEIPKEKRDLFKKADKSKEKVSFTGNECRISKHNINDEWTPFEDALELKVFPCLSKLTLTRWHKNIYEYLQSTPFITELVLENHGQTKLDFSKTSIHRLSIDLTGVEELRLNDDLEELVLLGDMSDNCQILVKDHGASLRLQLDSSLPKALGLKDLGAIHCSNILEIDFAQILNNYPRLRELRLWGKPGHILNFHKLSEFKELVMFSTVDLFGFTAEDIPKPEDLPRLSMFWMSSLPEEAAKVAKKYYKKQQDKGLNLWITKPRKAEWLAQNLDNPFRSWDGQENISTANAKKAASLYRKTRASLIKLLENPNEDTMKHIEVLIREYTQGFNKMDKRNCFIETIEREDIYDALVEILDLLPEDLGMDKEKFIEIFDELKDF